MQPLNEVRNSLKMEFVLIPSGEFVMGSPPNEGGRKENEPQHKVKISEAFYWSKTTVTQDQWTPLMGTNPSKFLGNNRPVQNISWFDAVEFCTRLSQNEGKVYRLPTEAEWESACKAGLQGPYCNGGRESLDEVGRYRTQPKNEDGTDPCFPVRVGSFKPNAWGLYDVHGNVHEWCSDYYDPDIGADAIDPAGPTEGTGGGQNKWVKDARAARGGSWNSPAEACRSANRIMNNPTRRQENFGFRIALEP